MSYNLQLGIAICFLTFAILFLLNYIFKIILLFSYKIDNLNEDDFYLKNNNKNIMKQRFIDLSNKQLQIYDAETSLKELVFEFIINFIYGFAANIMVPFIILKSDIGILLSFGLYYYMLSYILNRDKYESKLGRYILMPVPCILGAFTAIKIGYIIAKLII